MRLLPRSLGGQIAILLGLALLVAQFANFALILNERQKLSLAQNQGPAVTRFTGVASDLTSAAPEFRAAILADASHGGARYALAATSGIADAQRDPALEARLQSELAGTGYKPETARAAIFTPAPRSGRDERAGAGIQIVQLAAVTPAGQWLTARIFTPKRDPWFAARLGLATVLLYLIVLGAAIWAAMRIARPLRHLTRAAIAFRGRSVPIAVPASGPSDVRAAIEAFNAMNVRLAALLDEKDRMLGAIGHDLRTPLASLRIRVESMEPEVERDAAIATIGELTAMLEDILVLARTGRAREGVRAVDVAALAEAVVEELRLLGLPVTFSEGARAVASVQPDLLRRALRNLIDNAVAYGGGAEVRVTGGTDAIRIAVIDHGPGIPAEARAQVLQPFVRLEGSRNRATGGSGLGLAIAQSIAESHGGTLELGDTAPHGLTATLILPH